MGMADAHRLRWLAAHRRALSHQLRAGDIASTATSASRISRMLLQSLMLALGAYLSIQGQVSAGAMIASSILATRALAPIEQIVQQWRGIEGVRAALRRCRERLAADWPRRRADAVARPAGRFCHHNLYVAPLGETEPVLKGLYIPAVTRRRDGSRRSQRLRQVDARPCTRRSLAGPAWGHTI